ncbi:hypothetical protein AK812_SmicGene3374 [Symbiodinium microadriaticum]|uniref:Auto-transporter adhesin head GIN domain-containing protein n=1 Tax=Symbiodinium microadriaticum TaxID=2951 RepID=A0A1Q9EZ25_SYMMI|nr:hypothetical protein AK812_SmicGene3374 [Symbiodinium microadriaticum]
MRALCVLLQLAAVSASSRDWLAPFRRLQVSAPMVVHVTTDPARKHPVLEVAADAMGLGWTVQSQVQVMTFGSTLLLGTDDRAVRQHFAWPKGGQIANLTVPEPLEAVAVTGGADVWVDNVTGVLAADGKSNLTVGRMEANPNISHFILADDANITIISGVIGDAVVQAWSGGKVNLEGSDIAGTLSIKVDPNSSVLILPSKPAASTKPVKGNATANISTVPNSTVHPSSNVVAANTTQTPAANASSRVFQGFMQRGFAATNRALMQTVDIPNDSRGFSEPGWATDPFPGADHATIPVSALPAFLPVREVSFPRPQWPQEEAGLQVLEQTLELLWRGEKDEDPGLNSYNADLLRAHSEQ